MRWQDRISVNPNVCHGKPCIKGTRVLVSVVLADVAVGERPGPSSVVPIASPFLSLAPVRVGRSALDIRFLVLLAHEKTLACRRGFWSFGLASSALVPASSLPPGAGNEYEYALNTELEGAK